VSAGFETWPSFFGGITKIPNVLKEKLSENT
jgi:hypothetical protein